MREEERRERARRLYIIYLRVRELAHVGKASLLVERCAFVAAVVAFYQSIDLSPAQIARQIEDL